MTPIVGGYAAFLLCVAWWYTIRACDERTQILELKAILYGMTSLILFAVALV